MVKSKRLVHRLFPACIGLAALVTQFLSCGLEEYYYLDPVPQSSITMELNNKATIQMPSSSYSYFTHFSIFYRVYISGSAVTGTIQTSYDALRNINPALAADFSAIYPLTDITNTGSTNVGAQFKSRRFYELELYGIDIASILDSTAFGGTMVIEFPPNTGSLPTLTLNGASFSLYRSTGDGTFAPRPNRYFLNHPDLNSSANTAAHINADVADNIGISSDPAQRYTYAIMYLSAIGLNSQDITIVYSKPVFIGIFRLPQSS